MNILPNAIEQACQILKEHKIAWDIDESVDLEYLLSNPLSQLANAFVLCDVDNSYYQLARLAMFAARRALPCWELYCDRNTPHAAIEAIENWLVRGEAPNSWQALSEPDPPTYRGKLIIDCRYCDTSFAAAAAADAVRFIISKEPLIATSAISYADGAFDRSPLGKGDNFRNWLVDIAVPAAYQQRELSISEQNLYRSYNALEIPLEREKYAAFWHE